MAGFFGRLFGAKASQPPQEGLSVYEIRAKALLTFLIPQLQLLGLELEQVPASGSYVSKRSRGYIYGTACAVLGATSDEMTSEEVEDIMQTAFTLVWGRENAQPIYQATLAECAARDGETLAGSYRAEADVGEVHAGKPHATVMGFWLLNNGLGNPEEKMPPIVNPRPLSSASADAVAAQSDHPLMNLDEDKVKLLCDCFAQIMLPQLERLGIRLGQIEHSSLSGSVQACGYVQGLCREIAEASRFEQSDAYGVMLGLWAFDELYGTIGTTLHNKTLEAIASENMGAIHGGLLAHEDFAAVAEKRPSYTPCGFYMIGSGAVFE